MKRILHTFAAAPLLAAGLAFTSCDRPVPPQTEVATSREVAPSPTVPRGKERQMAFLNRIREADPSGKTIERALLNEQNELGLILGRSVEMDKIPTLMRGMLTQMAKEFPGEDLTVVAYAPSSPPRKIGTARLDSRSRDMTYTPAG